MLVVLINESEGKAWVRTRRVLAKYLPQIGSRVWSGHISEEGLKDLHQAIKKVVSKSGSVACHRMVSRNRMELQWIAGKKGLYDEHGRYAFRTRQTRQEYLNQPLGPYAELVYLTRALAALLHDIGKATQAFQGKMHGCYHHEEYRHDLTGFLMLRDRFASEQTPSDPGFLDTLINQEALWPDKEHLFATPASHNDLFLAQQTLKQWLNTAPVFTLVGWLVLTHHRLPDGTAHLEYHSHYNTREEHDRHIAPKKFSRQAAGKNPPWENERWRQHVAQIAANINRLLASYPNLADSLKNEAGDWLLVNVHYNRPLLIASDHLASIQCNQNHLTENGGSAYLRLDLSKQQKPDYSEQPAYANAYRVKGKVYWGDTVSQHLLRVEKVNRKLKALLQNQQQFRHAQLPKQSLALQPLEPESPYYWQQMLEEGAAKQLNNKPVFASLLAETGSGKTLAGVRLLNAISRKNEHGQAQLRYTLALGLRSLTLQSGEALRNQAQLNQDDFATLVGGLVFDLDEQDIDARQHSSISTDTFERYQGSENAGHDDAAINAVGGGTLNPAAMPWLDCLDATMKGDVVKQRDREALFEIANNWLGPRGLSLLDTPVVACTVDHIAPATHACNGGDARMALRLFSSDLVLDEIDNYSAQDLVTLGKLCFMVGLSGRHVVLMSATMSPFIVQGLFDSWWQGLKLKAKLDAPSYNALTRPNIDARLVIASNQPGAEVCCRDLQTKTDYSFKEMYRPYVNTVCQGIGKTPKRRNVDIFPLTPLADSEDKDNHLRQVIYPEILTACRQLHGENAQMQDEIEVSVGFIRFNTAKQAWYYGRWLLGRDDSGDDFIYRVVCYHAKHPRLVLGLMDQKLNRLNNRKNDSEWHTVSELQNAIQETRAAGKQRLIIIVVTTTLQETGRDHDYDWAVLEPRSTRGEVQAAGRVRRHRIVPCHTINIFLLSQPLRAFNPTFDAERYRDFDQNEQLLWGMPGIEQPPPKANKVRVCLPLQKNLYTPFDKLGIPYRVGRVLRVDRASQALPVKLWRENGFDSILCLTAPDEAVYSYEDNPVGTLEHFDYFVRLNRDYADRSDKQSLNAYLTHCQEEPCLVLTKKQHELNRFRESFAQSLVLYTACQSEGYLDQDKWDGLLTVFCRRKREANGEYCFLKEDVSVEVLMNEHRAFFQHIERQICEHFTQKRPYKPHEALFYELNYYGSLEDIRIIYHKLLGFCVERRPS